jgi:hypothetical protein
LSREVEKKSMHHRLHRPQAERVGVAVGSGKR